MNLKTIRVLFLSSAVVFSTICQTTQAQTPSSEDTRLARLAGLARVWGTVKYFHPYLAYRNIDWDKAVVETIPKVNAAKTPQEYQAAINQMLSALNDPSTQATIEVEDAIPDVTATTLLPRSGPGELFHRSKTAGTATRALQRQSGDADQ